MDMDMRNIYSIQEKIIAALEEQTEKQERIIRVQDETIHAQEEAIRLLTEQNDRLKKLLVNIPEH